MTHAPNHDRDSRRSVLTRRAALTGVATIGAGALLAACGESGPEGLARIGEAPTTTALSAGHVTDEVLLRTATALEYTVIDAYERLIKSGHLSGVAAALVEGFGEDHLGHAQALRAATASPVTGLSARITSLYVDPAIALIEASDQKDVDAMTLAVALETLAASTYQSFTALLSEPALRAEAMRIGAHESRHASGLVVATGGLASVLPSAEGDASMAAIPSAFGSLSSLEVNLGPPSETGSRESLILETPSLNSLEYLD
jgi:hypothetical protein